MESIVFDRNGLVRRFIYNWNPDWRNEVEGMDTSTCSLVPMILGAILLFWPAFWLARLIGWVVRIVGAIPVLLIIGYKPAGAKWRISEEALMFPFVPIESWPRIKGVRVGLWMPFVVLFLVAVVYQLALDIPRSYSNAPPPIQVLYWIIGAIMGAIALLITLGQKKVKELEQLIAALKVPKGLCRRVEFR